MSEKELEKILSSISKDLDINEIEEGLLKELKKELDKSLTVTGGNVTGINKTAGNIIKNAIKNFYNSDKYQKSIAGILKNIEVASDSKRTFYKDKGLEVSKSALTKQQALVVGEYLDNLSESGLNSKFNQTLRRLIYDSIRGNQSQAELTKSLQSKIKSGKAPSELNKYVRSATIQAADAYTSIVDKEIFNKFEDRITGYRIVGTLIETSSPQCRSFVEDYGRQIKIGTELNNFINFAIEEGASEELTAKNLPVLKLHYGCRHQFVPYIE
jgi:hypothetical protein